MNLPPSPTTKVPLNTPPLQESPKANPFSLERHIQDITRVETIEQEIRLWMTQLSKGGELKAITWDIKAALAKWI